MSPINLRIKELIHQLRLNNASFSKAIGVSYGTLYASLSTRNTKPSQELLTAILKTFEQVNPDWLMKGEGEMFRASIVDTAIIAAALLAEGRSHYQVKQTGTANIVGNGNRQTINTLADCKQQLAYWQEQAQMWKATAEDKQTIIEFLKAKK